ncbi:GH22048 [Drosophila grimshawi]|uniref:Gamma-glutamylcyclotransferase family protein n=1 Tax=Drosophila grimshawi TaxID=7222 RepID=B4J9M8_DROGR|nr:GH22048 [Drosophila grimshawi]
MQKASSALSKLFVYGALKYGQPGNSILASTGNGYAKFWCRATTTQKLPLVIATRYNIPFLLNKPGIGYYVTGEIYEASTVDDRMLKSLDSIEDCQDIYKREQQDMNIGIGEGTVPCWVYLLQKYPEKLLSLPYLSGYENTTAQPYIMRHRRTHKHPAQDDLSYEVKN